MRGYMKEIREISKKRQEDMARKLCISESYYNQIERGERQRKMDIDLIQKLAECLNVSIEYIIEEENKLKEL